MRRAQRRRPSVLTGGLRLLALVVAAVVLGTAYAPLPAFDAAAARAARTPARFQGVTAEPGPGVGQITVSWRHDARRTTRYRVETALTAFGAPHSSLPTRGRQHRRFSVGRDRQSLVLTRAQVAAAGARPGRGVHLYVRVSAINTAGVGSAVRRSGLVAVMPRAPRAPGGTALRIASFNVRTAKVRTDARTWLERRSDVAATIAAHRPAVVALQELGPGPADGGSGVTAGRQRQTDSLVSSLRVAGASRYRLVRATPYVRSGRLTGSQGARILYDSNRLTLTSSCPDRTGRRAYSASCSIRLPLLRGDSERHRRRAAYATFRVRATGRSFIMVSLHLDHRHSATNLARERRYTTLRTRQVRTILQRVSALNPRKLPVVIAGDLNSWQSLQVGNRPHDALVRAGCYDTVDAVSRVNLQFSTLNKFARTQPQAKRGYAPRLDVICVQGGRGADRFVNVTAATDADRPSDHNLIYADTTL